jgi:hypothetical protein
MHKVYQSIDTTTVLRYNKITIRYRYVMLTFSNQMSFLVDNNLLKFIMFRMRITFIQKKKK